MSKLKWYVERSTAPPGWAVKQGDFKHGTFDYKKQAEVERDRLNAIDLPDLLLDLLDEPQRKPVPGTRHFQCANCQNVWAEESRDCMSPSGEYCERCDEFCYPASFKLTEELP